jgi:hypothetical protein
LAWLVRKLADAPGAVTASQLAAEYKVTTKTIYRDVRILRAMGLEIATNMQERDGVAFPNGFTLLRGICPFCNRETGRATLGAIERTAPEAGARGAARPTGPVVPAPG